jgi:hypothetical protein
MKKEIVGILMVLGVVLALESQEEASKEQGLKTTVVDAGMELPPHGFRATRRLELHEE